MNKKKVQKQNFTPLSRTIKKKLKKPKFQEAFSEEMNRLQIACEVRTLRQKKKMTQSQVAKKANMPQSVVARIESGGHSVSVNTLYKVAKVFNRQVGLVK